MWLFGLLYLVSPIDVIPDVLLGFGELDDLGLVAFLLASVLTQTGRFLTWESKGTDAERLTTSRRTEIRSAEDAMPVMAITGSVDTDPEEPVADVGIRRTPSEGGMNGPALCQTDRCGVMAIGRCQTCGLAFCQSHWSAGYINECGQCKDMRLASGPAARKAELRQLMTAQWQELRRLASLLDPEKIPQEKFYHATRRRKIFGFTTMLEDPDRHEYGWPVGNYPFTFTVPNRDGLRMQTRICPTFIQADGNIRHEGQMLRPPLREVIPRGRDGKPSLSNNDLSSIIDVLAALAKP